MVSISFGIQDEDIIAFKNALAKEVVILDDDILCLLIN